MSSCLAKSHKDPPELSRSASVGGERRKMGFQERERAWDQEMIMGVLHARDLE